MDLPSFSSFTFQDSDSQVHLVQSENLGSALAAQRRTRQNAKNDLIGTMRWEAARFAAVVCKKKGRDWVGIGIKWFLLHIFVRLHPFQSGSAGCFNNWSYWFDLLASRSMSPTPWVNIWKPTMGMINVFFFFPRGFGYRRWAGLAGSSTSDTRHKRQT